MIAIPTPIWPSDVIAPPRDAKLLQLSGETMGTGWTVSCYARTSVMERLTGRIESTLDRLVRQMSHWREDSDLSRFNRAAPGEWVELPAEFYRVLATALNVARRSDGAFDPALGREVDCWGFGPSGERSQPPSAPASPSSAGAWRRVELRSGSARQPGGARLDLSAIAKGYAVDSVAQRLASEGLVSYLVEIGGELRGRGVKPDGQPWWVSVEPPPGCPLQVTSALSGWAIATSGDYRRFFEHGGRRYAHTLDPRTGRPLDDPPASVSVLHAECMAADAWSTALMVLGAGRGLALCEREGLSAVFLLRDPWRAVVSRGFRRMLS